MKTVKEFLTEEQKGTYAGIRFSWDTIKDLIWFIKTHKIPSTMGVDDFHSTLLFSRKHLPNYVPLGPIEEQAVFKGFDVWPNKDGENALVMEVESQWMTDRHQELMDAHGATYDFDEYKPHVTLSYNVGDFDITTLPRFAAFIQLRKEYMEDLDLSWSK